VFAKRSRVASFIKMADVIDHMKIYFYYKLQLAGSYNVLFIDTCLMPNLIDGSYGDAVLNLRGTAHRTPHSHIYALHDCIPLAASWQASAAAEVAKPCMATDGVQQRI
jgi:hypothetical protein